MVADLYATGMYFTNKAKEILGEGYLQTDDAIQRETDPSDILNPGKVLKGGMLGTLMNVASAFEPIIRPMGNCMQTSIGERTIPNKKVSRQMWLGMLMPARNAAIVWMSATSIMAVAGKANRPVANGTGSGSFWKARKNGIRKWWIPFWYALPAKCAMSRVRNLYP